MSVALARRRAPRRDARDAEAALWTHLRGRRLAGFKFRRIEIVRFSNDQIFREREAVLLAIVFALDGHFPRR